MRLDRGAIARLVPHAGAMCLLEEVLEADEAGIVCRAVSHRDPAHPLLQDGALPAICGIEYAAQAMAVHGAIGRGAPSGPGMLAALREVVLRVTRLDDLAEDLLVAARRQLSEERYLVYQFELRAGARELVRGRASVALTGGRSA